MTLWSAALPLSPRGGYPASPPVDRSQWKKLAYERNPYIQELSERLFPLQRAAKLVELNQQPPAPASVADIRKCCRLLAMQAFAYYGYSESLDNMQRESGLRYEEPHVNQCMLRHYLSQAIQRMERVYDLFLDPDGDDSEEALEEHLTKVGWKDGDADVNIWDEPAEGNIVRDAKTGAIRAGTLNQLVANLASQQRMDHTYVDSFLMTYKTFTTPHMLLEKLLQRYTVPVEHEPDVRSTIQLYTVNVLKKWLQLYRADFDKDMLDRLAELCQYTTTTMGPSDDGGQLKVLRTFLKLKQPTAAQPGTASTSSRPVEQPIINIKTIFLARLEWEDIDDLELARQLTLLDFEIYQRIQAVNAPAKRDRGYTTLTASGDQAKVRSTIKVRVAIITKLLNIVKHLRSFHNLHTLNGIWAGLEQASVYRLEHTWTSLHDDATKLMDTSGQYAAQKSEIKKAWATGGSCLPPLHLVLNESASDKEKISQAWPPNFIDFERRKATYETISEFLKYQQRAYNFHPVPQIQAVLRKHLDRIDEWLKDMGDKMTTKRKWEVLEDRLMAMSRRIEPKGAPRSAIA
ncbi:RasGEF domain containing protein [Acanthamoeba castellanii str. Neff]|uniref:RasGEF domain containing protein n=1 Tax=Acanthamoeba castellanii (strain ATCC 30010 / Neff) TaxID=1257118 RepID=L8GTL9_ACACF|nr:RasGEF domain containing protein [Acanthamoeba castellanii str. Neff]ELR16360.1 RasGEF domain containing protein [Acanthamoeba castellanii str. Neff]